MSRNEMHSPMLGEVQCTQFSPSNLSPIATSHRLLASASGLHAAPLTRTSRRVAGSCHTISSVHAIQVGRRQEHEREEAIQIGAKDLDVLCRSWVIRVNYAKMISSDRRKWNGTYGFWERGVLKMERDTHIFRLPPGVRVTLTNRRLYCILFSEKKVSVRPPN